MEPSIFSNDLDAVLIGSDRSVRPKAVEHRAYSLGRLDGKDWVAGETGVRDIVIDADREAVLGVRSCQLIKHGLGHCWRKVFGGKTVAAANHSRQRRPAARGYAICERR